jgi:hypothetical protein
MKRAVTSGHRRLQMPPSTIFTRRSESYAAAVISCKVVTIAVIVAVNLFLGDAP